MPRIEKEVDKLYQIIREGTVDELDDFFVKHQAKDYIDKYDPCRQAVLVVAAWRKSEEMVKALKKHGAEESFSNFLGDSARSIANEWKDIGTPLECRISRLILGDEEIEISVLHASQQGNEEKEPIGEQAQKVVQSRMGQSTSQPKRETSQNKTDLSAHNPLAGKQANSIAQRRQGTHCCVLL